MMVDKEDEDFDNVSVPLTSLDLLQAQSQEHMAAVSRIPLVKLLGISPAGLNASSEGEIETFDDTIKAYQVAFFSPNLTRVIDFIQLSKFGKVDPDIIFEYVPLTELTEKEQAEVDKLEAEADQVRIDSGVLEPGEVRKSVASNPRSRYTNIDVNHVPEPPEGENNDNFGGENDGDVNAQRDREGNDPPDDQDEEREAKAAA
jgi:phage-related protein (TIGR01555 family)